MSENTEEQAAVEMDLTIFDLQDLRDTVTRATKDARFNNNFKAKVKCCHHKRKVCALFSPAAQSV